jgi:hypothetical protein
MTRDVAGDLADQELDAFGRIDALVGSAPVSAGQRDLHIHHY